MRAALAFFVVAAVLLVAGCGGGEEVTATPETVEGSVPTETTATTTTAETGDAAAGKVVFTGVGGCGACHTLSDAGTNGTIGPNLDDAQPDYALVVDRVTNGQGAMPSFKGQLTETQIQDVAAYVSSTAGS
jgi:sulfite dehydrogenase